MENKVVALNNYVRNFKDNTITESIKYKPLTGYRGRTTVQLFNAESGEIEMEIVSENVINNWIAKDAFDKYFRGQVTNSYKDQWADAFRYLVLSDTAIPERADAREIVGKTHAWADARSTYSGNAVNRGTLNTAESQFNIRTTPGKAIAHFVFDFPTHAANGVLRTIYWASDKLYVQDISGDYPWTGVKRCTNWYYPNYGTVNVEIDYPGDSLNRQKFSYLFVEQIPYRQGRLNKVTDMFYGIASIDGSLSFGALDVGRFNMTAADVMKCTYEDGSVYTRYPTIIATHIDPITQRFKVLFWTSSTSNYKDMEERYNYYEVTFAFDGTTKSIRRFHYDLIKHKSNNQYPSGYTDMSYFYYGNNGILFYCGQYTVTPSKSPTEYEAVTLEFNATLTSVSSINNRPTIASCLNEFYKTDIYEVDSDLVRQSYIYPYFIKDDIIAYNLSGPTGPHNGVNIVRRADNVCLYHSLDWNTSHAHSSHSPRYYYGATPNIVSYASGLNRGMHFGQITSLPSAQNLLPSDVVKTEVNTMKIQYDFIIDEVSMVEEYTMSGGK